MNEYLIDLYDRNVKKLEGSLVFGKPIDMDNPKEVAAAFYCMGHSFATKNLLEQHKNELDILLGK